MGGPSRAPALAVMALALVSCGSSAKVAPDDAGSPTGDGGSCRAAPPGATRVVTTLASSGVEAFGIAVQGNDVYWASVAGGSDAGPSGTGYLQTVFTSGGAVTILDTALLPGAVAADATNVYWTSYLLNDAGIQTSDAALRMTPRAGGPTSVLATGLQSAIALGPLGVYWVGTSSPTISKDGGSAFSTYSLMRTPLGGGAATSLFSAPAGDQIHAFAVDTSNLYWGDYHPGTGGGTMESIVKMALAGGTPVTLTTFATPGDYVSLAVGPSFVVWSGGNGGIESVPVAGGAVTTIFSDPYLTTPVAVDCGFVYWSTDTQVMKAPLSGGSPTVLAPLQQGWGGATGFAFDDASLYFAATTKCAASAACAGVRKVTPK